MRRNFCQILSAFFSKSVLGGNVKIEKTRIVRFRFEKFDNGIEFVLIVNRNQSFFVFALVYDFQNDIFAFFVIHLILFNKSKIERTLGLNAVDNDKIGGVTVFVGQSKYAVVFATAIAVMLMFVFMLVFAAATAAALVLILFL